MLERCSNELVCFVSAVSRDSGGTMNGLRSELSSVAQRNRMNDKRQQELEEVIAGMEDEAAAYSLQLIELEEKLVEKDKLNSSLENKVSQQSVRVVEIRQDLEKSINNNNELQKEVHVEILYRTESTNYKVYCLRKNFRI